MSDGNRPRIGDALVDSGAVTPEQLRRALAEQRSTGRRVGELLIEQGIVTPSALVQALAKVQGVPGCRLRHGLIDPALIKLIGPDECERLRCIPMFRVRGVLTVAMADPRSLPAIDRLSALTDLRIRPVLSLEPDILEFVKKYSGDNVDVDEFLTSLSESDVEVVEREAVDEHGPTDLDQMVDGSPIVNLVNVALLTAVRDGASDIHIEPSARGTRIRYRIDGMLRDLMRPPPGMHAAIVSRIKVIGKMDIAEKRLPQEGRVRIISEGREIDLRVSSMPTLLGEKLVVRVLDKSNLHVEMDQLGLPAESMIRVTRMLHQPHGMVLVTGPTGSGKTTTLYSALDLLRSEESNIVTVEDPVEYQLEMVNQIQTNEQIGLTFARALRSILRQDPDIIMVGEIRDQETARTAVQAALTGHLVMATIHTNDAPSTVARLRDMSVEAYLLASSLNGVIAQRLARTNCPSCVTSYYPPESVLAEAGLGAGGSRPFRHGGGCQRCHNSGFKGRAGIYEVLEVTHAMKAAIASDTDTATIRELHIKGGGVPLRPSGVRIALEGKTSLEEVLRVTRGEDDIAEDATASTASAGPIGETDTGGDAAETGVAA